VTLAPWVGAFVVNNFIDQEFYAFPIVTTIVFYWLSLMGFGYFIQNWDQLKDEWNKKEQSK
jgi:hypothetical protein